MLKNFRFKSSKREYVFFAILLSLILVLFFAKPIFLGKSLVPAETIYHIDSIYHSQVKKVEGLPGNGLLFDLVYQMYPWRQFSGLSLAAGVIPLWNPYSLTGLPFLANDQSSIFELTKVLSFLFSVSAKEFFLFSGFLTLLLAGFFTYLFTRNLRLSRLGSATSAFAFMFSGPVIVWLGYPLSSVFIWLPWLLLCIDKITKQTSKIWFVLFSFGIAAQFFGGNPEASWFVLVVAAAYALYRLLQKRPYRVKYKSLLHSAGLLILGLMVGLAIASVQILPTLEFISQSEALQVGRGGMAGQGVVEVISSGQWNTWPTWEKAASSFESLILLVYPEYYGSPVLREYWGPSNYNENAMHIGVIGLVLAILALVSLFKKHKYRADTIFWSIVAVVCLGVVAMWPGFILIAFLPVFKWVAIGRLRYILVFALAILAGYGLDWLVKKAKEKSYLSDPKVKLAIFNLVFLALMAWLRQRIIVLDLYQNLRQSEKLFITILFVLVNLILIAILFAAKRPLLKNMGKALLGLLIVGELMFYSFNYHPAIDKDLVYPKTNAIEFLQKNIGHYRMTSYKEELVNSRTAMLPNSSVLWQLQDLRGYEIVKPIRYEAFERHFGGFDDRFAYKFFDRKIFNTLGVKYFVQAVEDQENELLASSSLNLVYEDSSINIYENKGVLPRAFVVFNVHPIEHYHDALNVFLGEDFQPAMTALIESDDPEAIWSSFSNNPSTSYQSANITDYQPNQVTIETDAQLDGYLVLSDAYDKGWQAYVDGQMTKIYPTDIAFRGVFVSAGKHQIIFKYQPKSFYWAIYLSLSALLACLVVTILWMRKIIKER